MMINEQSVQDLNSRTDQAVTPLQFRPNLVVKGAVAFDEDNWKWVRIGDNLIFKYTGPCLRYNDHIRIISHLIHKNGLLQVLRRNHGSSERNTK